MRRNKFYVALVATASVSALTTAMALAAGGGDRREALRGLERRFSADVYPLLSRDVNGCRACHYAESPRMLRVLDSPSATFSVLLEQNLFDLQDPMAIPGRVASEDPAFRMPQAGELTQAEIELIRRFSADLNDSLSRAGHGASLPDERFPDSLLLPYDGEERGVLVERRMGYYQLRRSLATLFGEEWLLSSGPDLLENKANVFGGADFKSSFESSRSLSASYLTGLQEAAREVARRYVSAPKGVLFEGFDPDVFVEADTEQAQRNVKLLYDRILFREPAAAQEERALALVRELQEQPTRERTVRFSLEVRDSQGRPDRRDIDVALRQADASVSRFLVDQTDAPPLDRPWFRLGERPFRFEAGNPDHLVRLVALPGNHVTAFDAVRLVKVANGQETSEVITLDNLDPECTFVGDWEPIAKEGGESRSDEPDKKYEEELHVVGSSHLETRFLDGPIAQVTMALRIPAGGDYNVYLSWPAIPRANPSALLEVHSATPSGQPAPVRGHDTPPAGFATTFYDQLESTLSDDGETQWEMFLEAVFLEKESDFVEITNRGVDSSEKVIAADAVKFVPLDGGDEIVIDDDSAEGFERSGGWGVDALVKNSPGRGKAHGEGLLHYPPARNGTPYEDCDVDPEQRVWARYRPVQDGEYRPGWYSVYVWTPGGYTHADWVAVDVHGSAFAPITAIDETPTFIVGETAALNAGATYHPAGEQLTYEWSHSGQDLGLQLEGGDTPTPRFKVPPLESPRPGWAGLIEALLQHPGFLLPKDGPEAAPRTRLARVALDLVGRVPAQEEFRRYEEVGALGPMIAAYLDSEDFKEFFFHRARGELLSRGTEESDEPARLWTYIATNDLSYRELFTADYTVDAEWQKVSRPPEHGPTGMLTMKGYLVGKPGLPKFTYPAQLLTFAMGVQFEVSDAVEEARKKVVSTTDPDSMCYACHKLLTPLAYQRERWDIEGNYRDLDEEGNPIDDSDRGVIPSYPFKGDGLAAFATQLVNKERFVRSFINLHHDMLFHRQLRVYEDQRDEYRELYEFAVAHDLKIRPLLKKMILMRYGERYAEPAEAGRYIAAAQR